MSFVGNRSGTSWFGRVVLALLVLGGCAPGFRAANQVTKLQSTFLGSLAAFTTGNLRRRSLMVQGKVRGQSLGAASARSAARTGGLLRLRSLLVSLVGRQLIDSGGSAQERADYQALRACEDTELPRGGVQGAAPPPPRPFAPIPVEEQLASTLEPGSLGVALAEVPPAVRARQSLPPGAMLIGAVDPRSEASAAGVQPGDILLGAVGSPVEEQGGMKLFLASLRRAPSHRFEIVRDGRRLQVEAGLRVGTKAPEARDLRAAGRVALQGLRAVRGDVVQAMGGGQRHLLFFWATWCGVCKLAVPELLALEKNGTVKVVAITDESSEVVGPFLAGSRRGFPATVAIDGDRRAHEAFAVEGLPTFVLVDENGRVQGRWTGYSRNLGALVRGEGSARQP